MFNRILALKEDLLYCQTLKQPQINAYLSFDLKIHT
jgi:hypothetical protein